MQQYFVKGSAVSPVTIEDKETSKHMFQVMRLKEEDEVTLVFDDGIKRLARVLDVENRQFELVQELADNVELSVQVTIASGFPKGDKLEFITQKVTELGASQIWAFPADWSVAKWDGKKLGKKVEKLEKIALGAAEQSKRNIVPSIKLFEKKADFLAQFDQFDSIIVAYEESAKEGEAAALLQAVSGLKKEPNCSLSLVQKVACHLQKLRVSKLRDQSQQDLVLVFCEQKQHHFTLYQPLVFY